MATGAKPAFAGTMRSYTPFFRRLPELAAAYADSAPGFSAVYSAVHALDPRLAAVLQDLHDFSQMANAMPQTGETIHPKYLNDLMTSTQYRLLEMDVGAGGGSAELMRLSLLAYLATLFLRVPKVKTPFAFLGERLRWALMSAEPATEMEHRLYGWCLVVGAMSVLPESAEAWVQSRLPAAVVPALGKTWPEVQRGLRQVAWIDETHGEAGAGVVSWFLSVHAA